MRRHIKTMQENLRDQSIVVFLLVQLVLIFIMPPFITARQVLPVNTLIVLFVVIISFVVFAARDFLAAIVVVAALCLSVVSVILREISETATTDWLAAAGGGLAVLTLSWVVAKMVMAPGRMSGFRIAGAVVLYLNIAIFFCVAYRLIDERAPGAFAGIPLHFVQGATVGDLMYFSLTTLTTVGYGDIAPLHPIARSLANLEAVIGQLYPAIILGRMITLYTPKSRPNRDR